MKKIIYLAAAAAVALLTACDDRPASPSLKTGVDTLSYALGMSDAPSQADLINYLSNPAVGSDSTYLGEFYKGYAEAMKVAGDKKKAAYVAGLMAGSQMRRSMDQIEQTIFAGDSTQHLSVRNYLAGFYDGVEGKNAALRQGGKALDRIAAREMARTIIDSLRTEAVAVKYAEEKKAADDFMAAKAKEDSVQALPGGTLYKVITAGTGAVAKMGETVNVAYEGRLVDGTVFDASAQHPGPDGQSIPMTVGRSIPGFDAALQAMPAGSEWEIYIPYDQGYGAEGGGPFPPFSTLIFKVKVEAYAE